MIADESVLSQRDAINNVFANWQRVIKDFRGAQEDEDEEESQTTHAHFDLLAESITKLVTVREGNFGKQELLNATLFVDYDRIDQVEQEEEDEGEIS
jgi:hypothetical protein